MFDLHAMQKVVEIFFFFFWKNNWAAIVSHKNTIENCGSKLYRRIQFIDMKLFPIISGANE